MFNKKISQNDQSLNDAIAHLLSEMAGYDGHTDEYSAMADQLEKLYKIQALKKEDRVKPDTLALIAGNLAGIVLIVGHERAHVVTSKALAFVSKLK